MNIYEKFDQIAEVIREKAEELGVADGLIELKLEAYHPKEVADNDIPEGLNKRRSLYSLSSDEDLPANPMTSSVEGGIDISIGRLLGGYACPNQGSEVLNVHISVNGGNFEQNEQMAWAALPIIDEIRKDANSELGFTSYIFARDVYDKMDEMGLR